MTATEPRPWDRLDRLVGAGLIGLVLISLTWTTHGHYDARNDSSLYLLVTRALLEGQGLTHLGEPFVIRPPGFTVLLAPVMALFGADAAALNLYISMWGVALTGLVYVYLRPYSGGPLAAAAALLVWFAPGVQELCNQVMSDVPGATLLMAALILERRTRGGPVRGDLALGLFVGLAALVRTMDVLVAPAIVGARVIDALVRERRVPRDRRLWSGCGALVLGAALVVVPWTVYAAGAVSEGRTDQSFIHSYGTAQWHEDPADPGSPRVGWAEFFGRAEERLPETTAALGTRLAGQAAGPMEHLLGTIGLLAVLTIFIRRREPGELFVLGALLVVGTYFAFKPRLVLPLFVLSVTATTEVLARGLRRTSRPRPLGAALAIGLGLLALFGQGGPDVERIARRDEMRHGVTSRLMEVTDEGAVIGCATGWDLGVYLPGRRAFSLRFAFKRDGAQGLLRVLETHDVQVLALFGGWAEDRDILNALARVASDRFELLERYQGWVILRRTS